MKKALLFGLLAVFLAGCMSIPDSPNPRFYMLKPVDKEQVKEKIDISPDLIIGLGPVKIPEYLNRPQIVTFDKERMLHFSQFDRWGEALDSGLARIIREDLMVLVPNITLEMFPCNTAISADYQVMVDVINIEADPEKELIFTVQWSVIDLRNKEKVFTKRSEFRHPVSPNNYMGLVQALSSACVDLSRDIAIDLVSLIDKRKLGVIVPVDSKEEASIKK
ncbi:MAG: PqiC family protein [Candidatus Omnitrophica bacterium]|nr:PqiC family protein [Candidatus Omnitrophota bacterium]